MTGDEQRALDSAIAAKAPAGELGGLAFALALQQQLAEQDAATTLERAWAWCSEAHGKASPEALEVLLTLISEHARHHRQAEARAALQDLLQTGASGADAMAGAFHSSFKEWAQAEEHFERALSQATRDEKPKLLHAVGRTRLELGRLEEGRATLAEAARLGSAAAAIDLSDALAMMGKLDEARAVLDDARKTADPRWAIECTSRLGALYRASGNLASAEKAARDVVMSAEELQPGGAVLALFELAAVQAQGGKNAEALVALRRALDGVEKLQPRDEYAWAQAHLRIGAHLLYSFASQQVEAMRHLNLALGALTRLAGPQSPECAEVLAQLAVAALRRSELETAKGLAARSAALFEKAYGPGNPFAEAPRELLRILESGGKPAAS